MLAAAAWSRSGCRYSKHPATIYNGLHVELWPFKGPVPWRNRPLNYGLFERDGYLNRRLLARRRPPQILQQAARSVSQIPFRESHEKARVPRGRERERGKGETGPSSFENRVVHDFIPLVSDRFTSVILCKNLDLDETRRVVLFRILIITGKYRWFFPSPTNRISFDFDRCILLRINSRSNLTFCFSKLKLKYYILEKIKHVRF